MQSAKIPLVVMAQRKGCSIDDLLLMAETERIDVFAIILPCTTTLRNRRGQRTSRSHKRTINIHSYSVLLPHEVVALRNDKKTILNVIRQEGVENGVLLPVVCNGETGSGGQLLAEREEFLPWLDEPQTVTFDQLYVNHNVELPLDMMLLATPKQFEAQSSNLLDMPVVPPLSRTAIGTLFPEISKSQWRGLFSREHNNGLSACRISVEGKHPHYDAAKIACWVGNNRSEVSIIEACNRIQRTPDAIRDVQHHSPTSHDPFGLTKKHRS